MTVTRTITLDPTPHELAALFCDFDHYQQATFFERVKLIADAWGPLGLEMQMGRTVDECSPAALHLLVVIGEAVTGRIAQRGTS